jgi:RNA-directed DNA polymerase
MIAPPPLTEPSGGPWPGHPLFSLESLYRAYRQCRRRKRHTHNALVFEHDLEANLLALHEALEGGTYVPRPSLAFLVTKPKPREIFAADFRDRVVHHLLVGHLEPRWERRFIHDSYACRRGKGTHKAVERLRAFTRQVTATCRFRRARRADFERLPPHKTLFKAPPGCGLPIGNLTSQFFANVYLDPLDQFVKHQLKARYYLRYCDDLVLLSADQGELEDWERQIEAFLAECLHLQLNERRQLRPVADGIDFLGYITRPDYLLVRRRVVGALRARLNQAEETLRRMGMADNANGRAVFPWPWPLLEQLRQWLSSYLGHLGKASSHRLLQGLRQRYPWLGEYVHWQGSKVVFRCPVPRQALRLAQQQAWFATYLPGHVLLIRQGQYWEVVVPPTTSAADKAAALDALRAWPRRLPRRRLPALKPVLWRSGLPVAWIVETGRRLGTIAERALHCRWAYGWARSS